MPAIQRHLQGTKCGARHKHGLEMISVGLQANPGLYEP